MTVEQFIADTITVAQYLCQRFGVDKVHLMGHSWGSFFGPLPPPGPLTTVVTRLPIPAYFLHGRHDRTVSHHLAQAYAGQLDAPLIGFYTFEHSAHSPAFEEPDRTLQILTEDVLTGTTTLADPTTEGIR